jgi:hypothetical protein
VHLKTFTKRRPSIKKARLSILRPISSSSLTDIWLLLCIVEVEIIKAKIVEKEEVRLVKGFKRKSEELRDRIILEKWSA